MSLFNIICQPVQKVSMMKWWNVIYDCNHDANATTSLLLETKEKDMLHTDLYMYMI